MNKRIAIGILTIIALATLSLLLYTWNVGTVARMVFGSDRPTPASVVQISSVHAKGNKPIGIAEDPVALAYYSSIMTPISFYGKVVDEKGIPIEGARVNIGITDKMFQNGSQINILSDINGCFSITGVHGLGVGVSVRKEGYYFLSKSQGTYGYASGVSSDGPNPTPSNPAIFVLRKKGIGVKLIEQHIGGPVFRDGTPIEISLESGKVVAPNKGSLKVQIWSDFNPDLPNNAYNWSYRLTLVDGGLVERTDALAFEAPEKGYQSVDSESFSKDSGKYLRGLDKQYFVKFRDGRYARLNVDAGSRGFDILIFINPTPGDSNLEPTNSFGEPFTSIIIR